MLKTTVLLMSFTISFAVSTAQVESKGDSLKVDLNGLLDLSFENLMNVRVVTPTLNLQKMSTAPATVRVVSASQIRLRGYRNLAEILNDLPDFIVNDKSDPQIYNLIGARGITRQDYFVILLDGVRISSPTNEPLPILENFPIYLAKQIEVVYGPGSALYGADAMAGVINIITRDAGESRDLTSTLMGGSQGYTNASVLFNKKLKNNIDFSVGGQYAYDVQPDFSKIHSDRYNMTSHSTGIFNSAYGPMTPTQPVTSEYEAPIEAYNAYASLKKGGFSTQILHHYVSVPTSTGLTPDNAVYNKDVFYGQGVTMGSASYVATSGKMKSATTFTGSFYEVNRKSNFRNLYSGMEHGYKYSNGSMIKVEEQLAYSLSKKMNLVGGITYEIFQSVPKATEIQSPVEKNGAISGTLLNSSAPNNPSGIAAEFFQLHYKNIGAYFQGQYSPFERFSLTAGVRYDNNSRFGSTINPRLGAVFNPFEKTTVKALYGTAFWAPSPHVSFESYGSFYTTDSGMTYQSDYWHLPNPGLKPITSQTFEVSLNQKVGTSFDITLTAYKTTLHNLISDVSDKGNTNLYNNRFLGWSVDYIEVPVNKGTQNNYGGNVMVNSTFDIGRASFNAYSSVSYVEGKERAEEGIADEIQQFAITPFQFRAGVDGRIREFYFSVRLLQAGRQRRVELTGSDPTTRETLPGYSLLNVSTGYTFNENVTIFIRVQNALNSQYMNSLPWASTDFQGSLQDPLRAMAGLRLGF